MKCYKKVFALILLSLLVVSCGGGEQAELAATYVVQTNEAAAEQQSSAETEIALGVEQTQAVWATQTQEHAPTATATPTRTPRPTSTPDEAELRGIAMQGLIEELYEDGYVGSTEGDYLLLDDFDESMAQLGWYVRYYTDIYPADFVLRTHVRWDSASTNATLWFTGCGFTYRENSDEDHYLTLMAMDGYIYTMRVVSTGLVDLGSSFYGRPSFPSGEADIMLIVAGQRFTFFVDGERVHGTQDHALDSGQLSLTVLSGTNVDYGTRCRMSDIDLWIFGEGGGAVDGQG